MFDRIYSAGTDHETRYGQSSAVGTFRRISDDRHWPLASKIEPYGTVRLPRPLLPQNGRNTEGYVKYGTVTISIYRILAWPIALGTKPRLRFYGIVTIAVLSSDYAENSLLYVSD